MRYLKALVLGYWHGLINPFKIKPVLFAFIFLLYKFKLLMLPFILAHLAGGVIYTFVVVTYVYLTTPKWPKGKYI